MKTIFSKKTKKFKSELNKDDVYYCIYKGKLHQVKILSAKMRINGESRNHSCDYEYDIAGIGNVKTNDNTNNEIKIYKTKEDAINEGYKQRYSIGESAFSVIAYCEKQKLLKAECKTTLFGYTDEIITYQWNGYNVKKVVGGYGVYIDVDMLDGTLTISTEDNTYLTYEDCKNSNVVECVEF